MASRPPAPVRRPRGDRATIKDVAERAGASIAAVSRVLTGTGYTSPEMRERVERAIEELGYRPLAAARAMRGQARLIGVLNPHLRNLFLPDLIDAIGLCAGEKRYGTFVATADTAATQAEFYAVMDDNQTAGMILLSPVLDRQLLESVGKRQPLVVQGCEAAAESFDTVGIDERAACRSVVEHLAGLGHERIGWVAPRSTEPPHPLLFRTATFVEAAAAAGVEAVVVEPISEAAFLEGGHEGTLMLLDRDDPPTAIVLPTDMTTLGATKALAERGLRVPEDVSIMSFDNSYLMGLPALSITTVDQPGHDMGSAAARLLFERIEGKRTRAVRMICAPGLVVRSSTGPVRR